MAPRHEEARTEISGERDPDACLSREIDNPVRLVDEGAGAVPERFRRDEMWAGSLPIQVEQARPPAPETRRDTASAAMSCLRTCDARGWVTPTVFAIDT